MEPTVSNRWLIAAAGVLIQVALGAVYAWSVFRIPLTSTYGWSIPQVTLVFELAILTLGIASFVGGLWMKRVGPRRVALAAGLCYGLGTILAGQAHGSIGFMYLSYGILGGAGLGLGYIVPLATLIKWFPDKRGMITGLSVAGFGAGALVTAPIAQRLLATVGISETFAILGVGYLIAVSGGAMFMKEPPEGYVPAGWTPPASRRQGGSDNRTLSEALHSWQWYALWMILFLNTTAGISIISQAAPMAQEMTSASAAAAAGLVGLISIANGAGRLLWAWASDYTGRRQIFVVMFLLQSVLFLLLSNVDTFGGLGLLAFIILLCYGGGFGTMPAFAADLFGPANVGAIYGLMLTAWGAAGVLGPMLIAAIRERTGHYTTALEVTALIMLISTVVPVIVRPLKAARSRVGVAMGILLVLGFARTASAQAEIKVNEDVNLRFGILGQFWADTIDNPVTDQNTNNLFVRRLRLISGGNVAKNISFFVETDVPNLGRTLPTGKNITASVIVQDAYGEFKFHDAFALDAGLMFVPFSRNALQSAATLLPIDYGVNTFNQSGPEESSTGRDTGFQAKGYFLKNRLEYRAGVFQGERNAVSNEAFRYTGRAQYNFLDPEVGFFYTGTYLGKKKVLAVGGAFDRQKDFHGYAADAFFDYPVGPGAITAQVDYAHLDGGTTLPALLKQQNVLVEAGYYFTSLRLTPVLQYSNRDMADDAPGGEHRTSYGLNYWWAGQNANIKAAYTRINPSRAGSQNEFTVQFQIFYF